MPVTENDFNLLLLRSGIPTTVAMLVPLVIAIIKWKYVGQYLSLIFYYLLINFVLNCIEQGLVWTAFLNFEAYSSIFKALEISNTNFFQILYYLNDFLLLAFFYSNWSSKAIGNYTKSTGVILAIMALVNYFFLEGAHNVGIVNLTADGLFIIFLSAYYIWFINNSISDVPVAKNPLFMISLGLLLPQLFIIIFNFIADKIYGTDFIFYVKLSLVRNSLTILGQIFFAYAFYRASYMKFINKPNG